MSEWQDLYRKWHGIMWACREMTPPVINLKTSAGQRHKIIRDVSKHFGVTSTQLKAGRLTPQARGAMHVLCFMLHRELDLTCAQISALVFRALPAVKWSIDNAHARYPQDIHRLLTVAGPDHGDQAAAPKKPPRARRRRDGNRSADRHLDRPERRRTGRATEVA